MYFFFQYFRCPLCEMTFSYIGENETFEKDLDYIFETKNLSIASLKRLNSNGVTDSGKFNQMLFDELSEEDVCYLRRVYSDDFQMLGYAPLKYIR